MTDPADLKVKIFADGADRAGMLDLYRNPLTLVFNTNAVYRHRARCFRTCAPDCPRPLGPAHGRGPGRGRLTPTPMCTDREELRCPSRRVQ